MHSAIVITVEGLGTGLVGAYGSSTAETPALDGLAAHGILLDQCFLDSLDLERQLRSLWTGLHALQSDQQASMLPSKAGSRDAQAPPSCWDVLRAHPSTSSPAGSYVPRLLTDCERVAEAAERWGCQEVTLVSPALATHPAEDLTQCALMELFAAAAEDLEQGPAGLVWIHSRGLRLPWDAPLQLRRERMDPEDPEPPHEVGPPSHAIDERTDPDWIVGWGQVAAAQAAVVDQALAALWDTVSRREDARQWAWLFASLGGVPLGEHGQLGWGRPQLYAEELHAVAIIRPAKGLPVGLRRGELCQLPDLAATVLGLIGVAPSRAAPPATDATTGLKNLEFLPHAWGTNLLELGTPDSPTRWPTAHMLAMIDSGSQSWIRTPAWSGLFDHTDPEDEVAQLFVKPEDRWEVSEIGARRQDIVDEHRRLLDVFRQAVANGDRSQLPSLTDELCNLLR